MGLMTPQTVRVRTNGMTCKHYREKGYEFKKCGDYTTYLNFNNLNN